ncbi:phosphotransferase family protein [Actinoplanes derwentensis]|uniref:Predicted kinase, aminoglycoside phosphotransferase (APT) family n=1 Tax=Actinoplanes derwentensis TaxID=113562 RepID=A0A1H2BFN0_9ACTN|nr:phosphotransferase [Actinoplanes derwentensis]GID87779.1 hypothetical protein Ade03nite_67030 [Actinoplanes derwentensis]SDT56998.1 Predicted kinase, aminoglycoside phosphotransferase (APT) family [Actinoplanes derwentensis]
MWSSEIQGIAAALGGEVVSATVLAGGFSHETCLVDLGERQVVVRFGGGDSVIEAGVMAAARQHVPVPEVLLVRAGVMVIEYVNGTVLSQVLDDGRLAEGEARALGAEVGRVVAGIAAVTFGRPGFFVDGNLAVDEQVPWSRQLVPMVENCMGQVPGGRLDDGIRDAWVRLCAENAAVLESVDGHARLVHADINPKNILVTRVGGGWRVDAVLDWEFSYSGCAYGDAGNMARFGAGYPDGFLAGFGAGFADGQPGDLPLVADWKRVGRVLDMFALSDLVTRPDGHAVADQAAEQIRLWARRGLPGG